MSKSMKGKNDPVRDIIDRCCNDLHYETVNSLRTMGWDVTVSPYYTDPATDKPREVDIVATKDYGLRDGNSDFGGVQIRLFIECKYINAPIVFWFDKKNMTAAKELAKNNSILRSKEDIYLSDTSRVPPSVHHYID